DNEPKLYGYREEDDRNRCRAAKWQQIWYINLILDNVVTTCGASLWPDSGDDVKNSLVADYAIRSAARNDAREEDKSDAGKALTASRDRTSTTGVADVGDFSGLDAPYESQEKEIATKPEMNEQVLDRITENNVRKEFDQAKATPKGREKAQGLEKAAELLEHEKGNKGTDWFSWGEGENSLDNFKRRYFKISDWSVFLYFEAITGRIMRQQQVQSIQRVLGKPPALPSQAAVSRAQFFQSENQ
ncbi:unnamed protein product, partial [Amoebophrya sp. A25]